MSTAPDIVKEGPQISAGRIRHTISTGLSFIETAVRNLSGNNPDRPKALKIYSVGSDRLHAALVELDMAQAKPLNAESLGYNGIQEQTFTADHPAVIEWTRSFEKLTAESAIFQDFEKNHPEPSRERAIVVGSLWHRFSAFMPWFLCQAAAMVSTNEKRHYVIQTAFEELGMRDAREIHPEMFWNAAEAAGVASDDRERVLSNPEPTNVLADLRSALLSYTTDEEVLGILLGLEIPARENIETVYSSLAHNKELRSSLDQHKFFCLHRQIETEHVRLTISNFLRFCATEDQKSRFVRGFNDGLRFWRRFWDSASAMIACEKAHGVRRA